MGRHGAEHSAPCLPLLAMARFIARRLIAMIPVLFLVSLVVFLILHLTPGDPAVIMLGEEATPDSVAALRHQLGLDQSLPMQYLDWLARVARGDLGSSIRTNQPVLDEIKERLPVTFEMTLLALLLALGLAIPTGVISATRRNSLADLMTTTGVLFGISMPSFFLAILLIFVFAYHLRWFPPIGYTPIQQDWIANLKSMVLPCVTLGAAAAALISRQTRSSLLEVLGQDYIRTARAKGLRERMIIYGHALKNALIPVATVVGLQVGDLIGGAVITETIFSLPGIGQLVVSSIFERDFPLVQGSVLFVATVYLFVNLAVDLLYGYLDPRIRLS
jgi:peptide/nickel transport system permease protein